MGLFDSFKRLAQGKPIYDEQTEGVDKSQPTNEYRDDDGKKIYPEVIVERSDCRLNSTGMQVYANIKNVSEFALTLERLRFLGSDKHMPSDLSVGENMQYLIYDGPRPRSDRDVNFEITYHNAAGDVFSAMYYAEFKSEGDGTFSVKQFRKQRGVKDI